ncbi:MAG TPA: hypothetical protein VN805_05025 [Caulobacteraceae bacterium]|nr:hypothetical protein [Caulobacteraceae bacterium]
MSLETTSRPRCDARRYWWGFSARVRPRPSASRRCSPEPARALHELFGDLFGGTVDDERRAELSALAKGLRAMASAGGGELRRQLLEALASAFEDAAAAPPRIVQ